MLTEELNDLKARLLRQAQTNQQLAAEVDRLRKQLALKEQEIRSLRGQESNARTLRDSTGPDILEPT